MGPVAQDYFRTAVTVGQNGCQIGHGAAGHQQGRFLPHPLGGQILQLVNGRISLKHIIPQYRVGNRLPHFICGQGRRIAAQIYGSHGGPITG